MQNLTEKDISRPKMSAKYNCSGRIFVAIYIAFFVQCHKL